MQSRFIAPKNNYNTNQRIIFWLKITVSLLAVLEFGQDYIKSILNNSEFFLYHSLAYKIFWVLFIPFGYTYICLQKRYTSNLDDWKGLLKEALLIITITLLHLFIFSLFLHLASFVINDNPWQLTSLLTKKLSTRLYLGLSFYIIFSAIYYYVGQQIPKGNDQKNSPNSLLIKSGKKTTLVNTNKIHWIVSDGPYLEVYTPGKKYVILDSLKNIINSLPENFSRIHKSTIVNIDQIQSSKSRGNGDFDLVLKCGKEVRLSRNYAKPLKGVLH